MKIAASMSVGRLAPKHSLNIDNIRVISKNVTPKLIRDDVVILDRLRGHDGKHMTLEEYTDQHFQPYIDQYNMKQRRKDKCASNYIWCEDTKSYRTNIFSVDVKGTGAGGAFITVKDIASFWNGLISGKLLSKEMVEQMFTKQSGDGSDEEEGYYGYGVWIIENENGMDIPYFQGCDPGVSFISEYNPNNNMISVFVSNYCDNVWKEMR